MEPDTLSSAASSPDERLTSVLERLRHGHGVLSQQQFRERIQTGQLEVWQLTGAFYALVEWGEALGKRALTILTTTGVMQEADDAFAAVERGAKAGGAEIIIGIVLPGWTKLAMKHGYDVLPLVLMRKALS